MYKKSHFPSCSDHQASPVASFKDQVVKTDFLSTLRSSQSGAYLNTAAFASGIGAKSTTVAYGVNRADWPYIPGGVASGTALIRPDLSELKIWPFFWQQTAYVMGRGSTNYMFLVLVV